MKLLIRISSIRRLAWKQCRSCSADSDSMWLRLVGQVLAARVDALALALEHPRHRVLGQPVDLQPVDEVAQLARDRDVALGVAEADRRGDVERALAAVGAVHGRVAPRRAVDELAQREVHLHGLARLRQVAGALDRLEPPAGDLRERLAVGVGRDLVVGAVDHEDRAVHPLGQRRLVAARRGRRELAAHAVRREGRAVGVVRPGDRVLDLLGRVRLGAASSPPTTGRSRRSRRCASSAGLNLPQPRVVSGGFDANGACAGGASIRECSERSRLTGNRRR